MKRKNNSKQKLINNYNTKISNYYGSLYLKISGNKNYIIATAALFSGSIIFGLLFPNFLKEFQDEIIKAILARVQGKDFFEVTFFIIQNNLRTAFFGFLLGIIFLPVLAILINGFFIGTTLRIAIEKYSPLIIWRLFPHGIFELPAIILSFSYGLKIGLTWFHKDRRKNFANNYREAFAVFVSITLPLIIVAGIIEGGLYAFFR
ncbi:stage II sporulation protein M [Candidatus Woesearchaeota archaeon]|nr:stage II sporulation protein M [Candidatus Woesearchaeota archaeon]